MNIKKLFNKKTIIISLLFVLSLTLFAVLYELYGIGL